MLPICIITLYVSSRYFNPDNVSSVKFTMDDSVGDWDDWGCWGHRDNILYINPNLFDDGESSSGAVFYYNLELDKKSMKWKKLKDYIKLI